MDQPGNEVLTESVLAANLLGSPEGLELRGLLWAMNCSDISMLSCVQNAEVCERVKVSLLEFLEQNGVALDEDQLRVTVGAQTFRLKVGPSAEDGIDWISSGLPSESLRCTCWSKSLRSKS